MTLGAGRWAGARSVSALLCSCMDHMDVYRLWANRLATSVCQLRHDRMEQGPTQPQTGRSTFLLSSGGAVGGYC